MWSRLKRVGKSTSDEFTNMQNTMIECMEAELSRLHAEFKRLEDLKTSVAKTISEAI